MAPFFAYFVCYLPQIIHAHSLFEFYATHKRMIDIMSGHSPDHPYMSLWYSWPLMLRPIWYLFDAPGPNASAWSIEHPAHAIVGMANPAVLFFGELALLLSLVRWIGRREIAPAIVVVAFFSQFLPWALNPKGLEFFYYFYPSIVCLGPALGLALFAEKRAGRMMPLVILAICMASFLFFLPVWAAGIGVSPDAFNARMWLTSWR